MPEDWTVSLGEGAEVLADRYRVSRRAQDAFALTRHRKAAAAWDVGRFVDEVVAVPDAPLGRDQSIRPDTSMEALARLRPALRPDGTVTAGNASPLSDGAAALLLASESACDTLGRLPLARIASRAGPRWSRPCTGSRRSARPGRRSSGRASAGATSPPWSSTRHSPPRPWPAWPSGRSSTRPSSTRTAERSLSGTRWAVRAPASSPRSRGSCGGGAVATAWPSCAAARQAWATRRRTSASRPNEASTSCWSSPGGERARR